MLARLASTKAAALELLDLALELLQDCGRVMCHGWMGQKSLHDGQPHACWEVACIPEHMPVSSQLRLSRMEHAWIGNLAGCM